MKVNKDMRALSLLLVMALLGAIFVPAVSAEISDSVIEENKVSIDVAYNAAVDDFKIFTSYASISDDSGKTWDDSYVRKEDSLKVYDISGELLYYEFDIINEGKIIGEIRASANKLLGMPVLSISHQKNQFKERLKEYDKYLNNDEISITIISYGTYQALLIKDNSCNNTNQYVLDVYTKIKTPDSDLISYYNNIDKKEGISKINEWNSYLKSHEEIANLKEKSRSAIDYYTIPGVSLFPQLYSKWCGIASAQMVADYHGHYESQADVATHMGLDPKENVGCTFRDQYDYFCYYLNFNSFSSYGPVPWDDYRVAIGDEYSANHKPVIDEILTSIGYHDRVAAGWAYYTDGTKSLEIYDPAPVGVGDITTDFISANHPYAGFAEKT